MENNFKMNFEYPDRIINPINGIIFQFRDSNYNLESEITLDSFLSNCNISKLYTIRTSYAENDNLFNIRTGYHQCVDIKRQKAEQPSPAYPIYISRDIEGLVFVKFSLMEQKDFFDLFFKSEYLVNIFQKSR